MKSNGLLKSAVLTAAMLLPAVLLPAQSDSCMAKAPAEVAVGRPFQYTVTTHAKGEVVSADFGKFEVNGGPSMGTSTSIIMTGGQVDQKTVYTYTYSLTARHEGDFSIPGVTVSVDGKLLKSNFVIVRVVKGPEQLHGSQTPRHGLDGWPGEWFQDMPDMPDLFDMPDFSGWDLFSGRDPGKGERQDGRRRGQGAAKLHKNDVFVKASAPQSEAYQGEPVVVTYKLYMKPGLTAGRMHPADMPPTGDFWFDDLDLPYKSQKATETVGGEEYTVITLRQTAVCPRTAGRLTIPPLRLSLVVGVPVEGERSFGGFFTPRSRQEVRLESNELPLKVRPLPGAHSNARTDIVGNFTMTSSLSSTELHTNEAVTLTVTVSGTGNLPHVNAEDIGIAFPADWDVTRPRVTGHISAKGNIVTGSRTFKYTLIPRSEGDYIIPAPTYTYYHFATGAYRTVTALGYKLTVTEGRAKQPSGEDGKDKLPGNARIYKVSDPASATARRHFEAVSM